MAQKKQTLLYKALHTHRKTPDFVWNDEEGNTWGFRYTNEEQTEVAVSHLKGQPKTLTVPSEVSDGGHRCAVVAIGLAGLARHASLTSITIPESVTHIGVFAFGLCEALKSITIPEGVTQIGARVFDGCWSLKDITLPQSLTQIGEGAFADCGSLKSITIPRSVEKIGCGLFEGCPALTTIIVEEGNPKFDSREGCNAVIRTATNTLVQGCIGTRFPASVTEIGKRAFFCCAPLKSITGPSSVVRLGDGAFEGCVASGNLIIPGTVTKIGYEAFRTCVQLKSITLPEGLKEIGFSAFSGAMVLRNVTLPQSLTKLGERAFRFCLMLESVTIPKGVKEMGDKVFWQCEHLKSIILEGDLERGNELLEEAKAWKYTGKGLPEA